MYNYPMKVIEFIGNALNVIRNFPMNARREAGYQLDRIQRGFEPNDWKPMQTIAQGVREIRIHTKGQYRVIYIAKFTDAIYVLHAFEKKTQKTKQQDIEAAKRSFKEVQKRFKS